MRCAARSTPRAAHRPSPKVAQGDLVRDECFQIALIVLLLGASSVAAAADASSAAAPAPYTVKDGNKVDAKTLQGWKTWRALACERCHGANQEGLVGPPLVESLKKLSKEDFHKTVHERPARKGHAALQRQ